jgi:crotonobetainyl-CoA:carnitine CoA-transferase CaiB-like acyl-CoA transferase
VPQSEKPLSGIKVLELARVLAGPWAGQMLADLGADVIKVERAGQGDETRAWAPPYLTDAKGRNRGSAYFHSTNRGKRSIEIDFTNAEGREAVRRLAAGADILIENFKVGDLRKFGLDYPSLKTLNPGLIYCSVTGFGQTGPYAHRPGYDFVGQGMSGFMGITGEPHGEPQKAGIAYADLFTGTYGVVGILAALHARATTGQGAHIDMSLLDVQVGVLGNQALNYFATGQTPPRMGNAHVNLVPYQAFPMAEGYIVIAAGNDGQFARLCGALGQPDLAEDPRFRTNPDRVRNREVLIPLLIACLASLSRETLLHRLEAVGVPAGPVNSVADAINDEQIRHREMRIDVDGVPGIRLPILLDGQALISPDPSPELGQDTETILRHGWSAPG